MQVTNEKQAEIDAWLAEINAMSGEEAKAVLIQLGWHQPGTCFTSFRFTPDQMRRLSEAMASRVMRDVEMEEAIVRAAEFFVAQKNAGEAATSPAQVQ